MRGSLFHPCENTNRSAMCRAPVSVSSASRPAPSGSPSASKVTCQNGKPAMSSVMMCLLLVGAGSDVLLKSAHQVEQAGALELPPPPEVGGGVPENLLDLLRLPNELLPDGQEGGDRAGHVRRGHARARVLHVDGRVGRWRVAEDGGEVVTCGT